MIRRSVRQPPVPRLLALALTAVMFGATAGCTSSAPWTPWAETGAETGAAAGTAGTGGNTFGRVMAWAGFAEPGPSGAGKVDTGPGTTGTGATEAGSMRIGGTASRHAARARSAALPTVAPDTDPRNLVGLEPPQLAHRLGPPSFIRRDGPAEVWQYVSEGCVFDVYIYPLPNIPQVSYFEERSRTGLDAVDAGTCFRSIVQERTGPRMS